MHLDRCGVVSGGVCCRTCFGEAIALLDDHFKFGLAFLIIVMMIRVGKNAVRSEGGDTIIVVSEERTA